MSIQVEVSWGELLDKVTILQIKSERIQDPSKLANVRKELAALQSHRDQALGMASNVAALETELKDINEKLWDVEDEIRDCERQKDFGPRFIELARAVYVTNDKRCAVKRQINEALDSELVEEKSYQAY
jgi:uncharacterized protein YukE